MARTAEEKVHPHCGTRSRHGLRATAQRAERFLEDAHDDVLSMTSSVSKCMPPVRLSLDVEARW